MNYKKVRLDFPIFGKKGVPKEFVYFDSAATSQKPKPVIDAIVDFYENYNANVYRGVYDFSERATTVYESSRQKIAEFINATDSSEIVFTSGATEGINFVAEKWVRKNLSEGDEILISEVEHHSNLLPWQRLAKEVGATLRFIPLNKSTYTIGLEKKDGPKDHKISFYKEVGSDKKESYQKPKESFWEEFITEKTKFIAVTSDSNVLGPVWGVDNDILHDLIKRAKAVGAKVLVDATQTVPHGKIDVAKLDVDFLVFSGHKMLGPTGIGVLYMKKDLHDSIEPYHVGGSMVHSVGLEKSIWKEAPYKFEAGTPPIAQVVGLGAAVDYLKNNVNFTELMEYEANLCAKLIDGLGEIEGVTILGNRNLLKKCGHLVSFEIDGVHPHDIAAYLDVRGVMVRAGHHCAQPLVELLGTSSTLRASFYLYNTEEEIGLLLENLKEAIKSLKNK
jgi:cysteine desulfurase/selenocysteine lyase